nr:WD40 repeat domain-containing protein [Actinoplanes regularis]
MLTASRASEYSYEGAPLPGGAAPHGSVFTAALVDGLRSGGADRDNDGLISVEEAFIYAADEVRATGNEQTPQRWLYGGEGQIILAWNPRRVAGRPDVSTPPSIDQPSNPLVDPVGAPGSATGTAATTTVPRVATSTPAERQSSPDHLTTRPGSGKKNFNRLAVLVSVALLVLIGTVVYVKVFRLVITAEAEVRSIAISPDGKILAGALENGTAGVWHLSDQSKMAGPTSSLHEAWSVAFGPGGKYMAVAGRSGDGDKYPGEVHIWNLTDTGSGFGREACSVRDQPDTIYSIAFSPDGRTLATGGGDGTVRLWNLDTCERNGRPEQTGDPMTAHPGQVYGVAFSPNGKILASASSSGYVDHANPRSDSVQIWDVASQKQIGGHLAPTVGFAIAFSPDSSVLASGGSDGVRFWDTANGKQLGDFVPGQFLAIAFSPDGRILATGSGSDHDVRLWTAATHQQYGDNLSGHVGIVNTVAFSPDGKTLASGSSDHTIRLWDVATD